MHLLIETYNQLSKYLSKQTDMYLSYFEAHMEDVYDICYILFFWHDLSYISKDLKVMYFFQKYYLHCCSNFSQQNNIICFDIIVQYF